MSEENTAYRSQSTDYCSLKIENSFLNINKPKGMTSHDVVDVVRKVTGERRVGHAGTLDPLASGVLVIGVGREATRQLAEIVQKDKEYQATIKLGATSTTDDAEGKIVEQSVNQPPRSEDVQAILSQFEGEILQQPPIYSSIKIRGLPAHRRVRRGEAVELEPRPVIIHEIELLNFTWPLVDLRILCGPGVYIRSLARDLGKKLGTGGYLEELTRTRVGQYRLKDSATLDELRLRSPTSTS